MDGYTQLTFLLHFRRQISATPNAFTLNLFSFLSTQFALKVFDSFETKTMASHSEMLIV